MTAAATQLLTSQEAAISGGKISLQPVSDRVARLFARIQAYGAPRVSLDRAVYFTESFRETEHQPLVLRWAKARESG